jgi:hypothetical protein
MSHHVDIVFCIDCTGSMSPVLDASKKLALGFQDVLDKALKEQQKSIDALRVKVIAFRDYYCDGERSMSESRFFGLPADAAEYAAFVNNLNADGGGDEPESALEAFALAMKSDWNSAPGRKRRIICILTDASAHPLEKAASGAPSGYPSDLPKTLSELADTWEGTMDEKARRLLVFAPESYPWNKICPDDQGGFSDAIHYPSRGGAGLSDVDYNQIVSLVANSI